MWDTAHINDGSFRGEIVMQQGKKILVRQIRSTARRVPAVCRTIKALGLGRIGSSREHQWNQSLEGMLEKVRHLVKISEI